MAQQTVACIPALLALALCSVVGWQGVLGSLPSPPLKGSSSSQSPLQALFNWSVGIESWWVSTRTPLCPLPVYPPVLRVEGQRLISLPKGE